MARQVAVIPYQSIWLDQFVQAKAQLKQLLADLALDVQHIGSTAVVGLAAKPIVDLLLIVPSVTLLDEKNSAMMALGFTPRGENGIVGRRYFCRGQPIRTHHLHAFALNDPHIAQHLLWRDYLQQHSAVAADYATLKQQLAIVYCHDPAGYQAGKDTFIRQQLVLARQWRASSI